MGQAMRISFLVALLFCMGCSAKLHVIRNDTGQIIEATCTRGASCMYEAEDGKASVDSKFEPLKGVFSIGPKIGN